MAEEQEVASSGSEDLKDRLSRTGMHVVELSEKDGSLDFKDDRVVVLKDGNEQVFIVNEMIMLMGRENPMVIMQDLPEEKQESKKKEPVEKTPYLNDDLFNELTNTLLDQAEEFEKFLWDVLIKYGVSFDTANSTVKDKLQELISAEPDSDVVISMMMFDKNNYLLNNCLAAAFVNKLKGMVELTDSQCDMILERFISDPASSRRPPPASRKAALPERRD